jgi:hypothetical protein
MKEITDLILSYPRVHVKSVLSWNIMEDTIVEPPRVMKPLIIPVFDGQQYAFIF